MKIQVVSTQFSMVKIGEISPGFLLREGRRNHFEIHNTILNKAWPQEKLVNQTLNFWGITKL